MAAVPDVDSDVLVRADASTPVAGAARRAIPARPDPDDPCFLPALELVRRYRSRRLSPVEATQATLDRIAAVDPLVNALYFVDADGALAAARAAEARWSRGEPMGLLDGVAVTIKDSVFVAGMPTHDGTRAYAG